jgi:hypothetical protein
VVRIVSCDRTSAERQQRQREREALNLVFFQGDMPATLEVELIARGFLKDAAMATARDRGLALVDFIRHLMAQQKVTV